MPKPPDNHPPLTVPSRAVTPEHRVSGGLAPATPPRGSGILLHIASLPGPEGIGTLGASAHAVIDWLAQAGLNYWQVLPTCEGGADHSPYSSPTSLVGSPWLIDLSDLHSEGLLNAEQLEQSLDRGDGPINFDAVQKRKWPALHAAAVCLLAQPLHPLHVQWKHWRSNNGWVTDTALFQAIRSEQGDQPWWLWEPGLRDRNPKDMAAIRDRLNTEATIREVLAFLFDHQWNQLQQKAIRHNIWLFGDLPIYVAHNSVDVWANRALFTLDETGQTTHMAGVPPDAFSETGQLWRNPLYDWDAMAKNQYAWWVHRLRRSLYWTPVLRIDHFRGFSAYWAVPNQADNATEGEWMTGPGLPIFDRFRTVLGGQWLVAEDLGEIDEAVHKLRQKAGLLCTRVLQFAFETDQENIHLPQNCPADATLYTGTHDNDTTAGWWRALPQQQRARALTQFGCDESEIVSAMIRAALCSPAQIVIIPAQDLLGLGSDARMNVPGTDKGNWIWRMKPGALGTDNADTIRTWLKTGNRRT
jgi:4-alpha-glucanotransferase